MVFAGRNATSATNCHEIVAPLFEALQGYWRFVDEVWRAGNGLAICGGSGVEGRRREVERQRIARRPGETRAHICEARTIAVEPGGFIAGALSEAAIATAGSSEAVPVPGRGIHRRDGVGNQDKQGVFPF